MEEIVKDKLKDMLQNRFSKDDLVYILSEILIGLMPAAMMQNTMSSQQFAKSMIDESFSVCKQKLNDLY